MGAVTHLHPKPSRFLSSLFCGAHVTGALLCDWLLSAGSWCVAQAAGVSDVCIRSWQTIAHSVSRPHRHTEPKPAPENGSMCSSQWRCERRRQDEEESGHHYRHNRSGNVKNRLNIHDAMVYTESSARNQKSVMFTHLYSVSNAYGLLCSVGNKGWCQAEWQPQSPFILIGGKEMRWIVTEAVSNLQESE